MRRLVDDSFTCNASRKKAAFGDVGQYLARMDPARTIIAGNLECAGEPGGESASLQHCVTHRQMHMISALEKNQLALLCLSDGLP